MLNTFTKVYKIILLSYCSLLFVMEAKIRIMEATIDEAIHDTPLKINTIKVSRKAKTSEANLFKLFKTKNNLLSSTFFYIDTKLGKCIDATMTKLDKESDTINLLKTVWMAYIDFFVKHKKYIFFYSGFRLSPLYTNELARKQEENYVLFVKLVSSLDISYEKLELPFNLLWSFILDTTLLLSKRIVSNEIPYDEHTKEMTFHLLFDGLIKIVKEKTEIKL